MDTQMKPPSVRRHLILAALPWIVLLLLVSTRASLAHPERAAQKPAPARQLRCDPSKLPRVKADECRALRRREGRRLFEEETFGGNGRTCATCHSRATGTFSPADVQVRLQEASDPLFLHDALDDGVQGTSRIAQHATIRITLPLPSHLSLLDDPAATHVVVNRGTPTTLNTPALDPALMWDLRDGTLEEQALGAIRAHARNAVKPTLLQLELIAEFQRTAPRFFSSRALQRYAEKGLPPVLPEGTTESEKRGRLFFVDAPLTVGSKAGVCAVCHSGPMLNQANEFAPAIGGSPGARAFSVGVSEANFIGNPIYTFLVDDGLGAPVEIRTPDIGLLMNELNDLKPLALHALMSPGIPPVQRLADVANMFKTPSLWGVKHTAPYFHDNSATDLDELLKQYDFFFLNLRRRGLPAINLTSGDKADIKAYLQLLD
jgi:cytochrome c peroxidase